ncbi:hypothetical protein APHWI1_1582 [Anaplasma phagocytophilum str. ApWI1]|uniref:Uncharacterized protein n=2 Tax=Anaplasma phagocytophilum TaxID=948 RepID=A0A0F3NCK3_ANAPH|nr:hypothetical protein APHWEB_1509 [Anaplasma phagocytophilum str. Webster]KJV65808.1 hypothetical protein EPHNCH_0811 [Anaplasma phagocytophilum str. NCH-1]KJV82928.1 hypothetical protein APHHGE2_0801 [Anaplasma phagocytophilum str. HGE2]KJV85625.1 hypothetical protein APHWI1_1582 [Anaplasma phagocytophilum str. ApWI1]KJV87642.1 hypothetical protein APHNYW_0531 [Anaplasma phagocytophilum str. ApNYW]KJV99015.1 hypothetical protein OTSANNIE_0769 [Anaplasma phagocytophilum str. Annie]KJZ98283.
MFNESMGHDLKTPPIPEYKIPSKFVAKVLMHCNASSM